MFQRNATIWVWAALFGFFLAQPLWAAPSDPPSGQAPTEAGADAPDDEMRIWPMMDAAHGQISRRLLSSAEWLDAFFDDERYESEVNESRLKLSLESSLINGEGLNFDANTHLNIVLPELEERLSFELSADTDDEVRDDRPADRDLKESVEDEDDRGGVTAGFRYLLTATDRLNVHLKSGARIRSMEPVVYLGPRYRQTFDYAPWTLRFTQRLRWYSDNGWESISRLDTERKVFKDYFFRTETDIKWYEAEDGLFFDLDFSLYKALDARSAIEFQWNNRFQTRPHNQLSATIFRLRYRRRVWRDWLAFEVAPQIAYPRNQDYNFTPGVLLKFEMVFGFYTKTGYY